MEPPKVIKGWLGWAVIGGDVMVYARTRAEALRRWADRVGTTCPPGAAATVVSQNGQPFAENVRLPGEESLAQA